MEPKVRILLIFNKYCCFLEVKKYKTHILTLIQSLFFPNISNTTAFEWQFNFVLSVAYCYFCLSCVADSVVLNQSWKSRSVVCWGSRARLYFHDKEKTTSQQTKSNFTLCNGRPSDWIYQPINNNIWSKEASTKSLVGMLKCSEWWKVYGKTCSVFVKFYSY